MTTAKRQLMDAGLGSRIAARKPLFWPKIRKKDYSGQNNTKN